MTLPDGWVVHERERGRFAVTDAPLGTPQEPGAGEAGVFFVRDPGDSVERWRELVEQEGWTLEEDRRTQIGGVSAVRLTFEQTDARVPTRETVVLVPSRSLTILAQPVPYGQAQDGPAVYERHLEEFDAILDSIRFGAPRA